MSDFIDGKEEIEYALEATLETGSIVTGLGGVGGATLGGSTGGGLLLKERKETLELYPLSALARGLGAKSLDPFNTFLASIGVEVSSR